MPSDGLGLKFRFLKPNRASLLLLGVVAPLSAFGVIAAAVTHGSAPWLDSEALSASRFFDDRDRLGAVMTLAMQASMAAVGIVAIIGTAVLLRRRYFRAVLMWILSIAGVLALDPILKEVFYRDAIGSGIEGSFPSGNAMASQATLIALSLLLVGTTWRRRAVTVGAVLVFIQGIWLVAIQWHYPSDVVAGWLFATAWVSTLALTTGVSVVQPPQRAETLAWQATDS